MKIKIIAVSKTDVLYQQIADEFMKRISRFCDIELQIVKETPIKNDDDAKILQEEGDKILQAIPSDYYKIVLAVNGKSLTSQEFAAEIENIRDFEGGNFCFVIGGPLGLYNEVTDIADLKLSLSKMTLPHQLARIVLLEQIYRGFSILQGTGYHK